ncbi:putative RNA-directed DNA polymerase, eukaryota, reverse transcriptase zinc-binding domain protein [Tanacetum coccineum]
MARGCLHPYRQGLGRDYFFLKNAKTIITTWLLEKCAFLPASQKTDSDNQDDATTKHEPEQDNDGGDDEDEEDDFLDEESDDSTTRFKSPSPKKKYGQMDSTSFVGDTYFNENSPNSMHDFMNKSPDKLKTKIEHFNVKAEVGLLEDAKIEQRLSLLKNLEDLEHLKRMDIMQKTKVKCAMEDAPISVNEIKEEVWNCGGDKSPEPYGYTFKFIKEYWDTVGNFFYRYGKEYKVIAKVLANRLQQVVHSVISDVQTDYLQGRQIIDGPLIVNEVISWATKNKERLFILKVDFEKGFVSLDWNFLDHTIEQMGICSKWIKWIRGCLNSAYASVLVNDSPTKEFKICKGLRQGKWPLDNARNLCRILRCFNMASGLKVNFSKSKFFGIGVTRDEVSRFASILCFQPSSFPFVYLGLPIGANMNKTCNWKPIIEKFRKRLTAWKARSLSFGGRLTLVKSVLGSLGTYYFSLFKAPKNVICYSDKIEAQFLLGGAIDSNNKLAWIAWKKPIRDGRERTQLDELLNVLSNVALTASPKGWIFNSNDSTSFSTSEMRYIIDSSFLYSSGLLIHWNKNLPIKINIHSWRLSLNRLPTRFNLDRHGIDLNSVRCLVCDGDIETYLYLFVKYPIAVSIWNSISRWWSIGDFSKDINSLIK